MIGRLRARFWPYLARCPRCRGDWRTMGAAGNIPPCTLCGDAGQVTEAMASAYILTRDGGLTVTNSAISMRDALEASLGVAPWWRRRGIRGRMGKDKLGLATLARQIAKLGQSVKK